MRLSCESKSSAAPVREKARFTSDCGNRTTKLRGCNAERSRSSRRVVGSLQNGDIASKMAVEIAIARFQRMNPANAPKLILKQIFDTANLEIYEAGECLSQQRPPDRAGAAAHTGRRRGRTARILCCRLAEVDFVGQVFRTVIGHRRYIVHASLAPMSGIGPCIR